MSTDNSQNASINAATVEQVKNALRDLSVKTQVKVENDRLNISIPSAKQGDPQSSSLIKILQENNISTKPVFDTQGATFTLTATQATQLAKLYGGSAGARPGSSSSR